MSDEIAKVLKYDINFFIGVPSDKQGTKGHWRAYYYHGNELHDIGPRLTGTFNKGRDAIREAWRFFDHMDLAKSQKVNLKGFAEADIILFRVDNGNRVHGVINEKQNRILISPWEGIDAPLILPDSEIVMDSSMTADSTRSFGPVLPTMQQVVEMVTKPDRPTEETTQNFASLLTEISVRAEPKVEDSASHCEYYHAHVVDPQNPNQSEPYIANCEDIIQALDLTFDEGCEFKSLWRRGRARQGFLKAETTAVRDAVKAVHYAQRVLRYEERKANDGV